MSASPIPVVAAAVAGSVVAVATEVVVAAMEVVAMVVIEAAMVVVAVISVEVVVEAVIHAVTTRRVDAHATIAGSHTMTAVVAATQAVTAGAGAMEVAVTVGTVAVVAMVGEVAAMAGVMVETKDTEAAVATLAAVAMEAAAVAMEVVVTMAVVMEVAAVMEAAHLAVVLAATATAPTRWRARVIQALKLRCSAPCELRAGWRGELEQTKSGSQWMRSACDVQAHTQIPDSAWLDDCVEGDVDTRWKVGI